MKCTTSDVSGESTYTGIYCMIKNRKTRNLNLESFKRNFEKRIKNGAGAFFTGRAGTITSFIFCEALYTQHCVTKCHMFIGYGVQ